MRTVKIGRQIWTAENMAVTVDNQGNELVLCRDYFYPDGDKQNVKKYGLLYTWEAAMKIAPEGWHLPTIEELSEKVFKNKKFNALPAGYYNGSSLINVGNNAYFWSATPSGSYGAYGRYFYYNHEYVGRYLANRSNGFSVRLVKDNE